MNRKESIIVVIILLASFVGGAFATATQPAAPTSLTPQITSVDIEALTLVTGNGYGVQTLNPGTVNSPPAAINVSLGFSFAPAKGFTQVNSVLLTLLYSFNAGGNPNDALSVELNGHPPIIFPVSPSVFATTASPISCLEQVPIQMVQLGSNMINIGVIRGGTNTSVYNIFQVRLTVEYTFLG